MNFAMNEETLFIEALEIRDPAARSAFLDRACAGDAVVRGRLERLLDQHDRAGSFLGRPAVALAETASLAAGGDSTGTLFLAGSGELVGTTIGAYKLLQQLGEGGMGTVFMAEQTHPVQRKVALKLIKAGMDSKQVLARFEAERQALALMDHPNIARVLDAGTTDRGLPYFVMELVKGVPITRYCDDHHLTCEERLGLFVSVCHAVQHAHQKGIIHRDLKPSNVMVCLYDGKPVPKVIDFGVAKATGQKLTDKTLFTEYGSVVGTLEYMSPEQAEVNQLDVDTRSDVYSLGVLLYELLTGTTPLERKRFQEVTFLEVLRLIREEDPPRPSTRLSAIAGLPSIAANRGLEPKRLGGLVRGELDWIAMRALEKDRARRYETANGLAADVQRYLNDETVQACPPSAGYRLRKIVRRNKRPMLAVSLLVLALIGGIVGTTWGMVRATKANAEAVLEAKLKDDALTGTGNALAAARLSKRNADEKLFESLLAQVRANRLSRRTGQRFDNLEILKQATDLARTLEMPKERFLELRNAAIATLALPDLHLSGPMHDWPTDAYSFDFDAAHRIYARTDRKGTCSIRRVSDDIELYRIAGLGLPSRPNLSRDGKYVAVLHVNPRDPGDKIGNSVQLWHLVGATPRQVLSEENAGFCGFHLNSSQAAISSVNGEIRLIELPNCRQVVSLAPNPLLTRSVEITLHPTEPMGAVWSYHAHVIQFRDLRSGKVISELPQSNGPTGVAWHPNGQTVAVAYGESTSINLYDRTTLELSRTLEAEQFGSSLFFNNAGDRLAAAGWRSIVELFDFHTGQKLIKSTPMLQNCRFRSDDSRLAGAVRNGKLGTWEVGDGREYRILLREKMPANGVFTAVTLHPGGRLLACAMDDGIGFWDLVTGSELRFISTGGNHNLVHFEPSGSLLALCPTGLVRWPVTSVPDAASQFLIGPPERLPLPRGHCLGQSQDGRVIVTCSRNAGYEVDFAGGWILHTDRPDPPMRLDRGSDVVFIAASPDGKWVVTVTHNVGLAKVWDASTGLLVKELAAWGAGYPRFSPDSRWLSSGLDGGRLFAVGTWEPGVRTGGAGVFSPLGTMMVVESFGGEFRVIDSATGHELATLDDPYLDATILPVFSKDGTKLIGCNNGKFKGIRVWDLRLIRQGLATMGLDWNALPYPPTIQTNSAAEPLTLKVLSGDPVILTLTREERAQREIDRCRRAVKEMPDDAEACNELAWAYLIAPESMRNVKAALPLAEKSARLVPESAVFGNTLGAAYFRAERFREAVQVLRPNLDRQENGYLPYDLYFLAMSHHKLADAARARDYFDWAVRCPRMHPSLTDKNREEIALLHGEAAVLMGIQKKKE